MTAGQASIPSICGIRMRLLWAKTAWPWITLRGRLIEHKRAEAGVPTLEAAGRPPRYIATARGRRAPTGGQRSEADHPGRDLAAWRLRCSKFEREESDGDRDGATTRRGRRREGRLTRREAMLQLLRVGGVARGAAGAAYWLSERSSRPVPAQAEQARRDHRIAADAQLPKLTVVQGGEPRALVQQALANLGGIRRFVSRQDVVVLKPNIAWDRTPEQAANTNPDWWRRWCASAGRRAPSA